jgi:cytochrome c556
MVQKALFAFLALGAVPALAATDEEAVIAHRRGIMRTMGDIATGLSASLRLKVPDAHIVAQVKSLRLAAMEIKRAFEPHVAGDGLSSWAKAEIWMNWPDFAERIAAQLAKLAALEKAAVEGGAAKAGPMIRSSLDCRDCHDIYRIPKK